MAVRKIGCAIEIHNPPSPLHLRNRHARGTHPWSISQMLSSMQAMPQYSIDIFPDSVGSACQTGAMRRDSLMIIDRFGRRHYE